MDMFVIAVKIARYVEGGAVHDRVSLPLEPMRIPDAATYLQAREPVRGFQKEERSESLSFSTVDLRLKDGGQAGAGRGMREHDAVYAKTRRCVRQNRGSFCFSTSADIGLDMSSWPMSVAVSETRARGLSLCGIASDVSASANVSQGTTGSADEGYVFDLVISGGRPPGCAIAAKLLEMVLDVHFGGGCSSLK